MHLRPVRNRWWACLAALLLQACATTEGSAGGLGREESRSHDAEPPLPWEVRSEEEDEEARRAEVTAAVEGMRGVASTIEEAGAELSFRFWAQDGALTLLSWRRTGQGKGPAASPGSFAPGLESQLLTYAGTRTGEVLLTLRRNAQGWRLQSYTTEDSPKPLEAKSLPVRRTGVTADTLTRAHSVASLLTRGLQVPEGGSTTALVEVRLDDDRILDATLVRHESQGGRPGQRPPPGLEARITQVLIPFTHGIGPRTVHLELEASHHPGEARARWRVVGTETLRPPPPASPTLVDEHYALYERILREWREETEDAFLQAGVSSAEFLATWFVTSLALRGGVVLVEATAPRLAPMLARGGSEAVGWFRSFLARVRPHDREKFQRLWMRAQTRELSAAERSQLQKLMRRFEQLLDTKLDDGAKTRLRSNAKADFYSRHHPELSRILVDANRNPYPIHHRTPLEYAHLFPRLDINAPYNLMAIEKAVHSKINNVWTALRSAGRKAQASDVEKVAEIIDRHFARWYNKVYDPRRSSSALEQAERAAIREVRQLLNVMMKRE